MVAMKQIFYILVLYLAVQLPTAAVWQSKDIHGNLKILLGVAVMGLLTILVAENYRRKLALSLTDIGLRFPSLVGAKKSAALVLGAVTAGLAWFTLYFAMFRMAFPTAYAELLAKKDTGLLISLIENSDKSLFGITRLAASLLLLAAAEEFLFRGVIYNYLLRSMGWQKALLWSSGVFAIMHFNHVGLPLYFISGGLLCWVYHKSGSLTVTALSHFAYNFLLVIFAKYLVAGV